MSSDTFNRFWREAVGELSAILDIEHPPGTSSEKPFILKKDQVFHHYSLLYIKYLGVYRKLADSYDQMVHPQKRRSMKPTLEAVMGRMLQVKHLLRGMVDTARGFSSFGDHLYLDEILEDLKLTPHAFDVPVPRYFVEERREELAERSMLLDSLYDLYGIVDDAGYEGHGAVAAAERMTLEQAVRVLQANERGRQGRERAKFMREIRYQEEQDRRGDSQADPIKAAVQIQRVVRGHLGRVKARRLRREELVFIGMERKPFDPLRDFDPVAEAERTRDRRRLRQQQYEREYQEAVVKARAEIVDAESQQMRDAIADKTREWFILYKEQTGKFPDFPDVDEGGSAKIFELPLPREPTEEELKRGKGKGKGKGKKAAPAEKKKPPKKKGEEDEDVVMEVSKFMPVIQAGLAEYSATWAGRDESSNRQQQHEVGMIKEALRADVERAVRRDIDQVLREELENLKAALRKGKKGKKGKKKKKKAPKKKKGKKDLTANRSVEDIYGNLVNAGIVQKVRPLGLADYVGEYNLMAQTLREKDVFLDPSPTVVRQVVAEAGILPLGCHLVHQNVPLLKALCLYGPAGSGKTMLAHVIAHEAGANLINLSPANTAGKFSGLKQTALMVHMAFKIAKVLAPSVIYIDEVEKVFGPKKKTDPTAATRIKKLLVKEAKQITKEDRVLIVGCSRRPYDCSKKAHERALKNFFGRFLYLSRPDYHNRQVLFRHFLNKRHPTPGGVTQLGPSFDLESLAKITEGYTAGAIRKAVNAAVPPRRFATLDKKPLSTQEMLTPLAQVDPVFKTEDADLRKFTAKLLPKPIVPDDPKKKKGKGKGKGKGKK